MKRLQAIRRLETFLTKHDSPRFQMTLTVLTTALSGFIFSVLLYWFGIDTIWVRYVSATLFAYGIFILLLGIRVNSRFSNGPELDPFTTLDLFPVNVDASLPQNTADFISGGGNFGGGGASSSFGSVEGTSTSSDIGEGTAEAAGAGPGFPETRFFRTFNAPLEKSFTVVYWEQRGEGKSYSRKIPRSSMKVEQFISDLDELVDAVCNRLGKKKVTIFGHSWGSALGTLYAARFPEKVAAYVGSGQIGDAAAGEAASYEFALAEAQRRHHRKALRKLRAIGPPPHDASRLWTQRMWLNRLEGRINLKTLGELGRIYLRGPEGSPRDLRGILRGFRFSIDAMWNEVSVLNLNQAVPALRVPVFLFLGRRDHWVPPETSVAYFDGLAAPSKKLVWFEKSGHEPFADEPDKFNTSMVELVRPMAA